MTAKHKLNSVYALSALLLAGIIGGITSSWAVFWIALIAIVAAECHAGGIRW